jgi:diketogulonate reductase-like aldo/keto reductase
MGFMNKNSTIQLRSGNNMPVIALGTWQLKNDTASTVALAVERGYRHFDTSSDYGTHPGVGDGVKESGIDRERLYITTKAEEMDDAYMRTLSNLQELDLEYLDLMLIHRPPPDGAGVELWRGLISAKQEGLVRDIGVSNYTIGLIDALIEATGEVPVVNQIEWSPFGFSREMYDYCREKGIAIQAYSPLTRGIRLDDEGLVQVGKKYGKSTAQVLIRWNLQMGIVPLPKANQTAHLKENIDVFDFEIVDEDMQLLNSMNEKYSSLGSLPYL